MSKREHEVAMRLFDDWAMRHWPTAIGAVEDHWHDLVRRIAKAIRKEVRRQRDEQAAIIPDHLREAIEASRGTLPNQY